MKICFVEQQPYPETLGGGGIHILELGKALKRRGNEVHVITSPPEMPNGKGFDGLIIHYAGMRHEKFRGAFSLFRRIFYEIIFAMESRKIQREERFDLVLAQNPLSASFGSIKPFVLVEHGIHQKGFNTIKGLYSYLGMFPEKINLWRAKRIVCTDKSSQKYYGGDLIQSGVDFNRYKLGIKKDKTIIAIGRNSSQKQLWLLEEARKDLKDYEIDIYHNVDYDKLPEIYSKAKYIVIPSKFEGTPIVLLEAMASGCIPIITN